jgi:hypothetical protein
MGADDKPVKVKDCEITDDGCLVVEFNIRIEGFLHTKRAVLTPELLYACACEGDIPPKEETEYPGIPHVDLENVFEVDDDEGESEDEAEPAPPPPAGGEKIIDVDFKVKEKDDAP